MKIKNMKKGLFLVLSILFTSLLFAQVKIDSTSPYVKVPFLPPLNLFIAPDSIKFVKEDLKKKRQTIVMVFSPDCDHCIVSSEDLKANYKLFKKVNIVMATSQPFEAIKKFYVDLHISDFPTITVGYDKNYFLGTFFNVKSYPSIFLYDKKGNFKQAFEGTVKWETIAKAL
jgi:thiol-disulfide isomerase/thioredoxin